MSVVSAISGTLWQLACKLFIFTFIFLSGLTAKVLKSVREVTSELTEHSIALRWHVHQYLRERKRVCVVSCNKHTHSDVERHEDGLFMQHPHPHFVETTCSFSFSTGFCLWLVEIKLFVKQQHRLQLENENETALLICVKPLEEISILTMKSDSKERVFKLDSVESSLEVSIFCVAEKVISATEIQRFFVLQKKTKNTDKFIHKATAKTRQVSWEKVKSLISSRHISADSEQVPAALHQL